MNCNEFNQEKKRVVLLLDLDSFYAQCECVRLGFEASTTKLALMQWNSCLAVTYPARKDDVKRGDSWDIIAQKSSGSCLAVHVPILTAELGNTNNINDTCDSGSKAESPHNADIVLKHQSLEEEYAERFKLTPEQQAHARKRDIGTRRLSSHGKASIDRYRTASAMIFATVLEHIEKTYEKTVILERASIDEFFLDVTTVSYARPASSDSPLAPHDPEIEKVMEETNLVGQRLPRDSEDDEEWRALQRGALVARGIRRAVFSKLGFTLSAGIGPNKTLAKLGASYGKPNGQAMVVNAQWLLEHTEIGKCRNLGGKLGRAVQGLLPPNVPAKVASIAKYLSMPQLRDALGGEAASWVFNLARGIDREAVVTKNESALTKSITAFKSLPFSDKGYGLDELKPWVDLLVREIISRVERDAGRHDRYPRSCTVQYGAKHLTDKRNYPFKSLRAAFPAERLSTTNKIEHLCQLVPNLLQGREGPDVRLRGIGLCAVDFESRAASNRRIDSFFKSESVSQSSASVGTSKGLKRRRTIDTPAPSHSNGVSDAQLAKRLQAQYDRETRVAQAMDDKYLKPDKQLQPAPDFQSSGFQSRGVQKGDTSDAAFAKSLQTTYDREARVLNAMDRRRHFKTPSSNKIRSYFSSK